MQFLDDFKRAILVLVLLCCSCVFHVHLLIIIRRLLSQAHANLFPHHIFGPEPIDDQVNFDPSRPIQNGMFTLKGKRALFLSCLLDVLTFSGCSEQRDGSESPQHVDC